jgi:hypothetical protein
MDKEKRERKKKKTEMKKGIIDKKIEIIITIIL